MLPDRTDPTASGQPVERQFPQRPARRGAARFPEPVPSSAPLQRAALRIVLAYGVFASIWILASDIWLIHTTADPFLLRLLSVAKGWVFVAVTALLLYAVLRRQLRAWEREAAARNAAEEDRRQWGDAFQHCAHGIALHAPGANRILACNPAYARMHGRSVEEITGSSALELYESPARPFLQHAIAGADREGHYQFEANRVRSDGSVFPAQINLVSVTDSKGAPLYRVATVQDITERAAQRKEIERLNRVYATLSAINAAIARAGSREELFQEICRVTVEQAGFKAVWIGLCDPVAQAVRIVGRAGVSQQYLDALRVYADDRPEGQGPAGTCIREGRPCISNEVSTDPRMAPWRSQAMEHGLLSVAAFPIAVKGEVRGVFTLYSGEANFFQEQELALFTGAVRDISFGLQHIEEENRRRAAEEQLRASEERFRQMAESIGEVFWLASAEATSILYINPAFERLWGRPCAELYANPKLWLEMIHSEDRPQVVDALARLAQGEVYNIEYRILRPDGTIRWINDRGYPQYDAAGGVMRTCGVAADITETKRIALALGAESAQRRALFEYSPDGIVVIDPQTARIVEFNPAAHRQLGYTREEFAALSLQEIVADKTSEEIRAVVDQVTREGRLDFETRHRTKSGDVRVVRVTAQLVELSGRTFHHGVWRDVTERRRADERVRKLSRAVEQSPAVILITDRQGNIEYANPRFTELTGYTLEEVQGRNPRLLRSGETSEDDYRRLWETITHGGEWRGEFHNRRKDGSLFWEYASISPIVDEAGRVTHFLAVKEDITERKRAEAILRRQASLFEETYDAVLVWEWEGAITFWNRGAEQVYGYRHEDALGRKCHALLQTEFPGGLEELHRALQQHGRWEGELRQRTSAGKVLLVESRMVLVSEAGTSCVLEVNRDVSERHLLEEQLRQAQKMEAIGRLAGGVAHDFNNLLGVILGYSDLALEKIADAAVRKHVQEIHKAGKRAASLTRQLLAFSRKQVMEPRVINLNDLVHDMEKMLRRMIGEDIRLTTSLDAALGQVRVDPGQMEQVLMNLVVNARDAMPRGGTITLETRNAELDDRYVRQHVATKTGRYAQVSISDTGTGMDAATQARIFEPFFTTKKEGTGLGLATVYGIVKQSGGNIWVYSEPGKGSTFRIYLPQVAGSEASTAPAAAASPPPGGTETILLVEDSTPLRDLTQEMLELFGYTVLSAEHPRQALLLAQQNAGKIDLLLSDVVMPEMSGPQLAEKLKAMLPELQVLFISGYTDEAIVHHGILDPGQRLLSKPFSRETLAARVREALAARAPRQQ